MLLPIAEIRPRSPGHGRRCDPRHLLALIESIAVLGILEPIVISPQLQLLAGSHRLAAATIVAEQDTNKQVALFTAAVGGPEHLPRQPKQMERLRQIDRQAFARRYPDGRVPVIVFANEASSSQEHLVEIAENSARRAYSRDEILQLRDRLLEHGYTINKGRPQKGKTPVIQVLAQATGFSKRQLQRVLGEEEPKAKPARSKQISDGFIRIARRLTALSNDDKACLNPDLLRLADQVIAQAVA